MCRFRLERGSGYRSERAAIIAALCIVAVFGCSEVAGAGICGDNVGGERVACHCGDVVVSDVALRSSDPVFAARCAYDGLIVRASTTAETIVVDLAANALIGSGYGRGIVVERGGSEGALIMGGPDGRHGEVVGFRIGIEGHGSRSIRRIERMRAIANAKDGFRLHDAGLLLIDVQALRNGGIGIDVDGAGGRLVRVIANENGSAGIRVAGTGTIVDALAMRNRSDGIVVSGSGHDVGNVEAVENHGSGVRFISGVHDYLGIRAELNSEGDLRTGRRVPAAQQQESR